MAIKIDVTNLTPITFSNPWKEETPAKLTAENGLWNTGLSAANEPHADELILAPDYVGHGIVPDTEELKKHHIAAIQLYRVNQFIYLAPGDSFTLVPDTKDEAAYYALIPESEILKIEQQYVTEVEDQEEPQPDPNP